MLFFECKNVEFCEMKNLDTPEYILCIVAHIIKLYSICILELYEYSHELLVNDVKLTIMFNL